LVPDHEAHRYHMVAPAPAPAVREQVVDRHADYRQFSAWLPRGETSPAEYEIEALRVERAQFIENQRMNNRPPHARMDVRLMVDYVNAPDETPSVNRMRYRIYATSLLSVIQTFYGEDEARVAAQRLNVAHMSGFTGGLPVVYAMMATNNSSSDSAFARYFTLLPTPDRRPTSEEIRALHNARRQLIDRFSMIVIDATPVLGARDTIIYSPHPGRTSSGERFLFRQICARVLVMIRDFLNQTEVRAALQSLNVAAARASGAD
jgi:hypothetical protein